MQNNENFAGNENLFPILLLEGVQVVDSRLIAQALGLNHKDWLHNIVEKYLPIHSERFGHPCFQNATVQNSRGAVNQQRFCYLNEAQATFLATLSRNTPEVVEFKAKLVASFLEARKQIQEAKDFLAQAENAFATEDYVNEHFETLFAAVDNLIRNNNIFDNNFLVTNEDLSNIYNKVVLLEKATQYIRKTLQIQEEHNMRMEKRVSILETAFAQLQASQKQLTQQFEEFEKYLQQVRKRLGINAICFVYVFFSPALKLYKIGWADDTQVRQDTLRNANPSLEFVLAIPIQSRNEARSLEKSLHIRFAYCQHNHSEWFALTQLELQYCHALRLLHESHIDSLQTLT